jgi:hypothetical protein
MLAMTGILTPTIYPQAATATLAGVVKDSSGAVVPDAEVTVVNTDTNFTRTNTTATDGYYRFPELPVGNYQVRVTKMGFQTTERKGIRLEVAQQAVMDLDLKVGSASETVSVQAEVSLIQTSESSVGSTVNEQRVSDLPLNGRNWTDLTLLQPGVTQSRLITGVSSAGMNGNMFSSNGGTLHSNLMTLDGANMQNTWGLAYSSIIQTALGVEGIREYRVITNVPSAEYGLESGSQTVIVTKGGTNQWHGSAFEYVRNNALDARNYFEPLDTANVNGCGTDKLFSFPCKRNAPFHQNDFGVSFGGPIRRDKTFFFATYEGVRRNRGLGTQTVTLPPGCFTNGAVPNVITSQACVATNPVNGQPVSASNPIVVGSALAPHDAQVLRNLINLFPAPNTVPILAAGNSTRLNYSWAEPEVSSENFGQLRLDHNFSVKDTVFARFTDDIANQTSAGSPSGPFTQVGFPAIKDANHSVAEFITASHTHVFSPSVLSTERFSFSRSIYYIVTGSNNPNLGVVADSSLVGIDGVSPGTFSYLPQPGAAPISGAVSGFSAVAGAGQTRQDIWTPSADLLWTKGKHALKFGTLVNGFRWHLNVVAANRGSISFPTVGDFLMGRYSNYLVTVSPGGPGSEGPLGSPESSRRDPGVHTFGFYAQDDYRLTPRLTLNLGLRYEFHDNPDIPNSGNPNGMNWNIRNPASDLVPTKGDLFQNNSLHNFSPRIGFAWDVTGKSTTAIRGGAGIYYDVANFGTPFANLAIWGVPTASLYTYNVTYSGATAIPLTPGAPIPLTFPLGGVPDCIAIPGNTNCDHSNQEAHRMIDYYYQQTSVMEYNLFIDRQLPWQMGLSVGYVGSDGWHIPTIREGNPTVPRGIDPNGLPYYPTTTPTIAQCYATAKAPIPGCKSDVYYGLQQWVYANSHSNYNGLQVQLNKRLSHGLQVQAAYTWSKLIDAGQAQVGTEGGGFITQTVNNSAGTDRGPAAFDLRQNFHMNWLYRLPSFTDSSGLVGKLANGWWVGNIIAVTSGYPFTPSLLGNVFSHQNNYGTADRPNICPNFDQSKDYIRSVNEWFDPTMFCLPAPGHLGNEGRFTFRGPGFANVDFSINKDTRVAALGEEGVVQFRVEAFNVFNHPNFALPNSTIVQGNAAFVTAPAGPIPAAAISPTAGQITGTVNSARQIQLALKIVF